MDPFIGQIQPFPYNFAPRAWASCNGQLLAISQNTALFSLVGTTFGGDGRTTFALPDLRGRSPVHYGQGPGLSNVALGQRGGVENQTLLINQMPQHTHGVPGQAQQFSDEIATSRSGEGRVLGRALAEIYAEPGGTTVPGAGSGSASTTGSAGGSQPFAIRDPYLALHYCIALVGIFPSRS